METKEMTRVKQRERERQELKVGDLVVYDPTVAYLLNNDEILGNTGIVLGMNPSGLDIQVLVGSRKFWCYLADLVLIDG